MTERTGQHWESYFEPGTLGRDLRIAHERHFRSTLTVISQSKLVLSGNAIEDVGWLAES